MQGLRFGVKGLQFRFGCRVRAFQVRGLGLKVAGLAAISLLTASSCCVADPSENSCTGVC